MCAVWRNGAVPRPVPPVVLGAPEPDDRPVLWVVGIDPGGTSGWAVLRIEWDRVGEGVRAVGCSCSGRPAACRLDRAEDGLGRAVPSVGLCSDVVVSRRSRLIPQD